MSKMKGWRGWKNLVDYDLLGYRSGVSKTSAILYGIIPKAAKYIFTFVKT